MFSDSVAIVLGVNTDGASIYYTLDGSEPKPGCSELYEGPFMIHESQNILARAFKDGCEPSHTIHLTATKAHFLPSTNIDGLSTGICYQLFTGQCSSVNDIPLMTTSDTGVMECPSIVKCPYDDHFAYIFNGYLDVPAEGVWEFATISDDGSSLAIDGIPVVDNDGSHSETLASGLVALSKGFHSFELRYFENYEGETLKWAWKLKDEAELRAIPSDKLFHKK